MGAAEHFGVPVELLIVWIHDRYPGKAWTMERWGRWCQRYSDARERLLAHRCEPKESPSNAAFEVGVSSDE